MNSAYALFEIVFKRTLPLPWIHLIPIVVILSCYLGVAYVTKVTQGFYTYSFLDGAKHSPKVVAGYIIDILVAATVIFSLVRYLIVLRIWVTENKMRKLRKFHGRGQPEYGLLGESKSIPLHTVIIN